RRTAESAAPSNGFGRYPTRSAARQTRARVAALTRGLSRSASETVATETRSCRAMVRIVGTWGIPSNVLNNGARGGGKTFAARCAANIEHFRKRTSNIQHRTIELVSRSSIVRYSMLDVRCSMFDVRQQPREILPRPRIIRPQPQRALELFARLLRL